MQRPRFSEGIETNSVGIGASISSPITCRDPVFHPAAKRTHPECRRDVYRPGSQRGKKGIAESRDGRSLPVALEARGAGDEGRFNFYKGGLADAPLFIPPQNAPILGAGGMSTVPVARGGRKSKTKEKRQKDFRF